MQVKQEQVSPCEVELEIEVPVEKVRSAVNETYAELGKRVNVPGFRKGKAPRAILEKYIDEERVKEYAADLLVKPAYNEAINETKIEPYAPADVELVKFELEEPMVFKAKVPLAPKVELGDYVGLEIERKIQQISDQMVEQEIQHTLERYAKYNPVERPVQKGDVLLAEIKNNDQPDEEPRKEMVVVGKNLPDFDEGISGMQIGEEKVINVTYPEDFSAEELKGKTIPLWVKIIEINEKIVPELTDEWVKDVFAPKVEEGQEPPADAVDTVEKFRAKVREAMENAARDMADADVRNKLLEKVIENATVDFPQAMVDYEVHMKLDELYEQLKNRKLTLEGYLEYKGITYEQLIEQFEEQSKEEIKTRLVLREIIKKENIEVSDEELKEEIKKIASDRGVSEETMTAFVEKVNGKDDIKSRILYNKVMDFLVNASNIKNVG